MTKRAVMMAVGLALCSSAFATVWFVDSGNTSEIEDGTSWATAFQTIQPAIEAALADGGGEVWVAGGVYDEQRESFVHDPPQDTGSLELREGVLVYGGFSGVEASRNQRDWLVHETIIEGRAVETRTTALHVVVGADDATLDGFTITGGNASGAGDTASGGGVYNDEVSPTIRNCTIVGNWAAGVGGGMYNVNQAAPIVASCAFEYNWAHEGGSAMANVDEAAPAVSRCSFTGNDAVQNGGAMLNTVKAAPAVTECSFQGNAAFAGGAIYSAGEAAPVLTGCSFNLNQADTGGAVFNDDCLVIVTNCTFRDNAAGNDGGAMCNEGSAQSTIAACRFIGNEAYDRGGAMYNENLSSPRVTNSVFADNVAGQDGGAMYNSYCAPRITNCTFTGNAVVREPWRADPDWGEAGGAIRNDDAMPTLTNCILWDDSPSEIINELVVGTKRGAIVTYSDIEGGYSGDGNIDINPVFSDPNREDYRLCSCSPCVDAGNASTAPDTDIEGVDRPHGAGVDMGAYESYAVAPEPGCHLGALGSTASGFGNHRGDMVLLVLVAAMLGLARRRGGQKLNVG